MTIGFIGQGYIGKHYADDFEDRGFSVVRYSLEEPYRENKQRIPSCDIVFIAVPTPTTQNGSDVTIVEEALNLVGEGKIAVIKSTMLPGTTRKLADKFAGKYLLHSPEFLSKQTAAHDARNPKRNIIGIPRDDDAHREKAAVLLSILPAAPFSTVLSSTESEFLKYVNNTFFYTKIVYMNVLYDLSHKLGCDWNLMRPAIAAEPWIGDMHIDPIHKTGRGAGGICFIKDYAAFVQHAREFLSEDEYALALLEAIEKKNRHLLESTNKDQNVLTEVYGV